MAAAAAGSSTPPSPSLYVKNLDTRTKKPELARQLYVLFGAYGKVLDVVATRAAGMRGQAFVVFREQQAATAARRALDGFEFYGKALVSGGEQWMAVATQRETVRAHSAVRYGERDGGHHETARVRSAARDSVGVWSAALQLRWSGHGERRRRCFEGSERLRWCV